MLLILRLILFIIVPIFPKFFLIFKTFEASKCSYSKVSQEILFSKEYRYTF